MGRVWGEYEESIGKARERLGKGMGKVWERYQTSMRKVSDKYAKGIRCLGVSYTEKTLQVRMIILQELYSVLQ
jgi:hypothetical protein